MSGQSLLTYWEEFTEQLFANMNSLNTVIQQSEMGDPEAFKNGIIYAYNKLPDLINTPVFEALESSIMLHLACNEQQHTETTTTVPIEDDPILTILPIDENPPIITHFIADDQIDSIKMFIKKLIETLKGKISVDVDFSIAISPDMFTEDSIVMTRISRLLFFFMTTQYDRQITTEMAVKEVMQGIILLLTHLSFNQKLVAELSEDLTREKNRNNQIETIESSIERNKLILSQIDPDENPEYHHEISARIADLHILLSQILFQNDIGMLQAKITALEATIIFFRDQVINDSNCEPIKYTLVELLSRHEALTTQFESLQLDYIEKEKEKLELIASNETLARISQEMQAEIDYFKTILSADDAKARMIQQIKALQVSHGLIETKLKEAEEKVKKYEAMGALRVDRVMRENKALLDNNREIGKKVVEYEDKNKQLTLQVQSLLRDLSLRADCVNNNAEISELKQQVQSLQLNNQIQLVDLESSKARELSLKAQIEGLKQNALELESTHGECKTTFESLRKIHDKNTNMITNLSVDNAIANKSLRLTIIQQAKAVDNILKEVSTIPMDEVDSSILQTRISTVKTMVNDVSKRKFVDNFMLDKLAKDISVMSNMFTLMKGDIAFYNEEISRVLRVRFH